MSPAEGPGRATVGAMPDAPSRDPTGSPFSIGEEVLYEGERFVIAGTRAGPYPYRLLATRSSGTRIVWAAPSQMAPMRAYTDPRDDTARS